MQVESQKRIIEALTHQVTSLDPDWGKIMGRHLNSDMHLEDNDDDDDGFASFGARH